MATPLALRRRLLASLIIAPLVGVLPESAAESQAPARPRLDIEAVTFNIRYLNRGEKGSNHWKHRKQLVIAAMREFKADIFGLQEALRPQLDDLSPALPGYSEFGVGRDDGKERGEYCAILFRSERFSLDEDESGTFWLSDTPDKIGSMSWGNQITRICTWARFIDRETKRSFYVYNTHWDHRSQESRVGAAKLILDRIAARRYPDDPVILMGDFNASKENPAIQRLTRSLRDSLLLRHPDAADSRTFHGFKGGKSGRKIDHIFVPSSTTVTGAAILYFQRDGAYPSDHYPVRAALQFR